MGCEMSLSVEEKRKRWREASKRYIKKHPEVKKKYRKEHLEQSVKITSEWKKRHKDKVNKWAKVRYKRDKDKIIVRSLTNYHNERTGWCLDCGTFDRHDTTQFHHLSYNPNIFIELCKECHNKRHRKNTWNR